MNRIDFIVGFTQYAIALLSYIGDNLCGCLCFCLIFQRKNSRQEMSENDSIFEENVLSNESEMRNGGKFFT